MNYKLKYTGDQIDNLLDKVNDMDPESYVTKEEGKGLSTNDFTDPLKNKLELLNTMIKVTWSELVSLRNSAQLIPGCFYRIADYKCTTTQDNTFSAGHPFDIIVLALTNNSLSEEARACLHSPEDTYFQKFVQKVTNASWNEGVKLEDVEILAFMDGTEEVLYGQDLPGTDPQSGLHESAGVITQLTTFKNEDGLDVPAMLNPAPDGGDPCYYVYDGTFTIDDIVYDKWHEYTINDGFLDDYYLTRNLVTATISKTYTPKCNMDAWKLKYSLDNNRLHYVWAHSMSINLERNERYYRNSKYDENGHWAWSCLTDEIDVAYTDPNPVVGGTLYEGTYSSTCNTNEDRIIGVDSSEGKGVIYYMRDEYGNECPYDFKNIIFTNGDSPRFTFNSYGKDATVESSNVHNNIIKECRGDPNMLELPFNVFDIGTVYTEGNVIGLNCRDNTFLTAVTTSCNFNVLKNECSGNIIKGSYNTLGNSCRSNDIGYDCDHNTFADNCANNILQSQCSNNTFEDSCTANRLYSSVENNYLSKKATGNTLSSNTKYAYIGRWSNRNTISGMYNTLGNDCQNNKISGEHNKLADNCHDIIVWSLSNYNCFERGCYSISISPNCSYNSFGSGCTNISFNNGNNGKLSYCNHIQVGDDCANVTIKVFNLQTSQENPLKNIKISNGVKNKTIEFTNLKANADFEVNIRDLRNVIREV